MNPLMRHVENFGPEFVRAWQASGPFAESIGRLAGNQGLWFCGMGGSGCAGDIAAGLAAVESSVPVGASHSYELPRWLPRGTTVVCMSYSGRTEETLCVLNEAVARGLAVGVVSAGS